MVLAKRDDVLFERLVTRLGTGLAAPTLTTWLRRLRRAGCDLLVGATTPRWGRPTQPTEFLDEWEPDVTDFVNDIISEAWRHGARMHRVSPERLPERTPLAALYRY